MGIADTLEQAMGAQGNAAAPAPQSSPAEPGGLAAGLEAAFDMKPAPKPAKTISVEANSNRPDMANIAPITGAAETALSTVSGVGANIIGGWRGLQTLASGGSMADAANAVNKEVQERTYQPQTEAGQTGQAIMSSPYNPLNWPGMIATKAGEKTTDVATKLGASPEVAAGAGTAVTTGLTAAPLLLTKGKGAAPAVEREVGAAGAPKPRIKLKVQEEAPVAFTEVPEVSPHGALPMADQQARAALLKRIGLTDTRQSAITGDATSAATDFQSSKLDTNAGRLMQKTLDNERAAVTNYAEKIVNETGGTVGMDESARMARGNSIVAPLQSIKNYFDKETKALYKEADARAAGKPVDTPRIQDIISDESTFLGTTEGEALLRGVKARMKALKMVDEEGKPLPVTVAETERLSQYLNDQWQPRTSRLISKLKSAIEEDVTSAAGEDIYQKARAMRAMRSTIFENDLVDAKGRQLNNGLAKIVDASGKRLELLKPTEKIADAVTNLPPEELQHVIETLKHSPKEIQPQALEALAEIRAHMANKVLEEGSKQAGQWNAKGVTRVLNNNAEKMRVLFSPEEMAKFKDLNDAGHILKHSQAYPGAAVQEHNLVQRGVMGAIRAGSTALGSAIGAVPGAVVGERLGSMAAKKAGEGMALRATQKRIVPLRDFPK